MLAVVSDSTPIIYLTRLQLLSLLRRLHETVIIPEAVWQEVTVGGQGLPESGFLRQAVADGWIQIKTPSSDESSLGTIAVGLGRGEVEAILLAKELRALLLTDDAEGRELAERVGLKVSGTLGVLIRGKTEGHLPSLRSLLDRLRRETNFRMTDQLYRNALKDGGELPAEGK